MDDGLKYKIYTAELIQPACSFCGSVNLIHNGHLKTNIHYITANASQPIVIRLLKQRVKCRDCSKGSMAQCSLVNKYCCISNKSKLTILSVLTEDRSMTSIAREHNTSVNTVQRVLASCSHRFIDGYDYLPEHLAFDEFKGVDRKLHFICLNGETHEVVQILRNRFKKNLLKYFGKFTLKARANVKTVTMDLNFYYQDIIRACFPNAQIIIDRFHMVQMLTRSLNSLRVAVMKKFDDLEKIHPRYNWHYKDSLTQEQIVMESIECDDTLTKLQAFFTALDKHDTKAMKDIIYSKEKVGPLIHRTLLTFRHNLKAVLNGASLPYSNGCLEGFNRKIKQIERTAYGYSNFINLLTRIRLEENKVKEKGPSNLLIA